MTREHTSHTIAKQFDLTWVQDGPEQRITEMLPTEALLAGNNTKHAVVVAPKVPTDTLAGHQAPGLLVVGETPESLPSGWRVVVSAAPRTTLAHISALFQRPVNVTNEPPSAPDSVVIGPGSVTGAGTRIGDGTIIGANVSIGENVTIGEHCIIHPGVVVMDGCVLGDRVVLHANAVIGADGFGFAPSTTGALRIHHVGNVVIGDDVEIGANTCVDRAVFGSTTVGSRTKIDNLCQVGHNVQIGTDCIIAGLAGIAGSTTIGNGVTLAGNVVVNDHISIGDGVTVGGNSAVIKPIPAGETWLGSPARPVHEFRKHMMLLRRLEQMWERVKHLPEAGPDE